MSGAYDDLVIDSEDPDSPFPTVGPYRVQIDSSEIVIRTGSTARSQETGADSSSRSSGNGTNISAPVV
jgi:hypothetical protein